MRHPTSLIGVTFLLFVVAVQSGYAATSPILELERRGLSTSLILLIHAYTQDAASLDHVRKAVRAIDEFRDADLLVPELPFGMFSMASSTDVVAKLLHLIDATWEQRAATGKPYARIVLVGHSIGGLFARKVYAAACGENADNTVRA